MRQVALALSHLYADEGFAGRPADSFSDVRPAIVGSPAGQRPFDTIIDLTDVEGASLYCSDEAAAALREAISAIPERAIHWIDTGDYHYLSLFWLEKVREPFTLVLFDNHPDDQPTAFDPDALSCGSWVAAARSSLPLMKGDVWVRRAKDVSALLLPNPGSSAVPVASSSTDRALTGSATLPLYLSIDLDVISPDEFSTDWDQGDMTFDELCSAVAALASRHRIIGIDVCGGITESKGATGVQLARNASLRSALLSFLGALLL